MTGEQRPTFVPPVPEGVFLLLRPVQPVDAEYIHGLRVNTAYNLHLSYVTSTVEGQRAWIERYQEREAVRKEIYYIIERSDTGINCGTVRLYNITADSFTWGSWILDGSKPPKAALESAVMSFGVGFGDLGCNLASVDVRVGNSHAVAFYRSLRMTETHRTAQDIYFDYPRARFEADRGGYMKILTREFKP
jgi:hypothetical protein